ncbi:MAG: Rossmann fold nucleotide-binding protein Smf possibly involved in DNA uptake [uncultured Nocardioidaceae bacterium]|uniref:Rossmann fold nucleotide-binding protein Smf possibly involved in DNA uptake n=1 Tax=uncultured Nocardioidaceae bacterium TaxID=253824 RepID=A0A6J4MWI6_9ACTN|nr:MAG: Rossmann fold nucleotide-binding protein Smf possibly involved in DNA uptake [uncultured Nocardioidaceae bacterium]
MPVDDDERDARIVMSRLAEPGDADACRLVREYSAAALLDRLGSGPSGISKLADWAERFGSTDAAAVKSRASAVGARYICPGDEEWPRQLDDLEHLEVFGPERRAGAPFGLWVRGSASCAGVTERSVAIVGARSATAYGEHVAGDLAMGCTERGHCVVSGGAYGIDAAAHRGALAADRPTVAVLAGGVDRFYPTGNASLLEAVLASGLVVSEAAPGCAPSRSRFLVRNRLIAALTLGTVVVEAALRSGSLNTARWARDLNRWVLGVPGPVTSRMSAGVNELLRQPETTLVTDAAEVAEQLAPVGVNLSPRKSGPVWPADDLDGRSRQLLDAVPVHQAATVTAIARAAGLRRDDVSPGLERLRERGLVEGGDRGWRLRS